MKRSILALGAMAALSLTVGSAQAQFLTPTPNAAACPADPRTLLSGTYTFSVEGVDPYVYGIVGTFFASPATPVRTGTPSALGPNVGTITSITASSIIGTGPNGTPRTQVSYTRLETEPNISSTYQVNPINGLCPGGTLTFNLSSRPMQYDFFFVPNSPTGEIYLVSTLEGRQATGRAQRSPYSMLEGCPAVNPFEGLMAFTARGIDHMPIQFSNYAIAGVWNAAPATAPRPSFLGPEGVLTITATSGLTQSGSVARLETDFGRYQTPAFSTFPNQGRTACSGTLTFNLSSFPVQYDYWWYSPSEIVFISTNALPIMGEAKR